MIDFPVNPTVGQSFQVGNTIYKCVAINPAVWSATIATAGIPDAPVDANTYGRKGGAWEALTKASVGLGNVDNTSDANKPVSGPQAAALVAKAGSTMTGDLLLVTPVFNDWSKRAINSEWFFGQAGAANPQPPGTPTPGIASKWSREDHIHSGPFAAGTRLLFAQAAAPVGWTQVTDDTADNRMLRVVKDATGGTVAGTHSPILMNVVPSHTHGYTTGTVSADHTHWVQTGGQNTSHLHGLPDPGHSHHIGLRPTGEVDGNAGYGATIAGGYQNRLCINSDGRYTGGSGTGQWVDWADRDHSHNATSGGISANHTHSGGTDNGSSQTNWAPRYINLILCTKT